MMIPQRFFTKAAATSALMAVIALGAGVALSGATAQNKPKRPKITLRSNPAMAFAPATITFTAELKDGDNDYQEFYCADVEWDWADGTHSESSDDCEPYEAGKSEIRRRYAIQHKYNIDGVYEVQFRLKQRGKVVVAARTKITVRGSLIQ